MGNGFAVARAKLRGATLRFTLRRVDEDDLGVLERFDFNTVSSVMAAPSRAPMRTPLTSSCHRRHEIAVALGAELVSAVSPALSVAPSTRASARIGSASPSPAKPLASGTKRPERSDLGNGLAPQDGSPPPASARSRSGRAWSAPARDCIPRGECPSRRS